MKGFHSSFLTNATAILVSWDYWKTQGTSNASNKTSFLAAINILEAVFVGFHYWIIFSTFFREMTLTIGTAHNLEQNIKISLNGNLLEIWNKKM